MRDCGGNAEDNGESCAELSSRFDGGGEEPEVVAEILPMNHD